MTSRCGPERRKRCPRARRAVRVARHARAANERTNDAVEQFGDGPGRSVRGRGRPACDVVLRPAFDEAAFERTREQDARTLDEYPNERDPNREPGVPRRALRIAPYGQLATAARTRRQREGRRAAPESPLQGVAPIGRRHGEASTPLPAKAALERWLGQLPRREARAPFSARAGPDEGTVAHRRRQARHRQRRHRGDFAAPRVGATDQLAASLAVNVYMNVAVGRATVLRDELKLVPWTETVRWFEHSGGLVGWRAKTSGEHVAPLLGQADAIARDLADKGPTPDEAELIRNWALSGYTAFFATPALAADEYYKLLGNGRPLDALVKGPERIAAVTPEALRDATRELPRPPARAHRGGRQSERAAQSAARARVGPDRGPQRAGRRPAHRAFRGRTVRAA